MPIGVVGIGGSGLTIKARSPFVVDIELLKRLRLGESPCRSPSSSDAGQSAGLPDDVLDLPLGDEGVEEGLDHLLVGVGQMLDGLELAEQLAVGDAGGSGLVAGPVEQVIAGGVERVSQLRQGVADAVRLAARSNRHGMCRCRPQFTRYQDLAGEFRRAGGDDVNEWRPIRLNAALVTLRFSIAPAYAQDLGDPAGSGVLVSAVRWLEGTLLGTVATVVAVIAVASVGFLMLTGRINWRYGATVILGCFILFGAASIVAGIQSTASLGG